MAPAFFGHYQSSKSKVAIIVHVQFTCSMSAALFLVPLVCILISNYSLYCTSSQRCLLTSTGAKLRTGGHLR